MEDEKSHYEMFQQLHYMLTGEFVQNPPKPKPPTNLKASGKRSHLRMNWKEQIFIKKCF